ncbi:MAG: putative CRISPR-associated protein [Thioploca sp.]|nr:putative CRISPR-associated protein [Thioploca sp.]
MSKPYYILSPCGTSTLTHRATNEIRSLLNRYTNEKDETQIPETDRQALQQWLNQAKDKLAQADVNLVVTISAELNGIIKFYQGQLPHHKRDYHRLLCTDTWLGEESAKIIKNWLEQHHLIVEMIRQPDLQTNDLAGFQSALSDITQWCIETLASYSKTHQIIFNLTGGFKSVQGFLQTLATFYADETIYIFESGKELLRIPRLPIQMAPDVVITNHVEIFRQLALGLKVTNCTGIPETLLMEIEGNWSLSLWGQLVWEQSKKSLYAQQLFSPLTQKINFSEGFKREVENLGNIERLVMINERIDELTRHFENVNYNPQSLNFKPLKGNPEPPSTHEFYAWSDQNAKRIFGHFEKAVFVLDKLGKHL